MKQDNGKIEEGYKCSFLASCRFIQINAEHMPELIHRIREHFCRIEDAPCARRHLYKTVGPHVVPDLMLPEQSEWAQQIIEEYEGYQDSQAPTASVESDACSSGS